jgi:hypothetical protein
MSYGAKRSYSGKAQPKADGRLVAKRGVTRRGVARGGNTTEDARPGLLHDCTTGGVITDRASIPPDQLYGEILPGIVVDSLEHRAKCALSQQAYGGVEDCPLPITSSPEFGSKVSLQPGD